VTAVPPHSESSRLRASDEDRDRTLDVLRAAAGDGRLTAGEFGERMEAALSARTLGDLAALTADLTAPQAKDVIRITQRGGSVQLTGRWVVPRRLELRPSWCDVTLDFTDAVITQDTLRVDLNMRGGTLLLLTGPGVVVDIGALTVRYTDVETAPAAPAPDPAAPVTLRVELSGHMKYGRIQARRAGD
jgi:Domain of unknown function (DUF1707)